MNPRLFVGSSTENLASAYAIQQNLEHDALVTVWPQNVFMPMHNTLDSLLARIRDSDFAAFVFAPEDPVQLRDEKTMQVRDNVLFELGLFIGALGRDRSFIVMPRTREPFHLPTDLLGLTTLTYEPNRPDDNLRAALGPTCHQMRQALKGFEAATFGKKAANVADLTCSFTNDPHELPAIHLDANQSQKVKMRFENLTSSEFEELHVCFHTPVEMHLIPWRHRTKSDKDPVAPKWDYYWLNPDQVESVNQRSRVFDFVVSSREKGEHQIILLGISDEKVFVQRLPLRVQ